MGDRERGTKTQSLIDAGERLAAALVIEVKAEAFDRYDNPEAAATEYFDTNEELALEAKVMANTLMLDAAAERGRAILAARASRDSAGDAAEGDEEKREALPNVTEATGEATASATESNEPLTNAERQQRHVETVIAANKEVVEAVKAEAAAAGKPVSKRAVLRAVAAAKPVKQARVSRKPGEAPPTPEMLRIVSAENLARAIKTDYFTEFSPRTGNLSGGSRGMALRAILNGPLLPTQVAQEILTALKTHATEVENFKVEFEAHLKTLKERDGEYAEAFGDAMAAIGASMTAESVAEDDGAAAFQVAAESNAERGHDDEVRASE
jgi:hypothetical protein